MAVEAMDTLDAADRRHDTELGALHEVCSGGHVRIDRPDHVRRGEEAFGEQLEVVALPHLVQHARVEDLPAREVVGVEDGGVGGVEVQPVGVEVGRNRRHRVALACAKLALLHLDRQARHLPCLEIGVTRLEANPVRDGGLLPSCRPPPEAILHFIPNHPDRLKFG
eukprot:CAMPEP_0202818940 /NCGR_PEP_ID=MMETSP1389-20130828/8727_1 /ASSEMBLY_ACC=CAM_ASM_000865 /TAXON_ID=302021 /ORGANISM="Rhodomonas sp., Strain CCMP768" /LENGTH=165 /DNA_ID=CAMNT_0049491397 /DNA_START=148 /DNA_END=641 /DNA_ORIENTATION=+